MYGWTMESWVCFLLGFKGILYLLWLSGRVLSCLCMFDWLIAAICFSPCVIGICWILCRISYVYHSLQILHFQLAYAGLINTWKKKKLLQRHNRGNTFLTPILLKIHIYNKYRGLLNISNNYIGGKMVIVDIKLWQSAIILLGNYNNFIFYSSNSLNRNLRLTVTKTEHDIPPQIRQGRNNPSGVVIKVINIHKYIHSQRYVCTFRDITPSVAQRLGAKLF